jgi:hypothetical protein
MRLEDSTVLRPGFSCVAAFAILTAAGVGHAEYTILETDRFTLDGGFIVSLYGVTTDNLNFGAGVVNHNGEFHRDVDNSEYYFKPGITFAWRPFESGEFYGGLNAAAVGQTGDGDPGGFTSGASHVARVDSAYGGWRTKLYDLSFGRQEFTVGDQFLIGYNANFNSDRDANLWVFPFKAFENSAILRLETSPLRSDTFWVRSDEDQGDAELAGINVEHPLADEKGKFGAMFAKVVSANPDFVFKREGIEVYDVRANAIHVPWVENLTLNSELAFERGSDSGTRYDAHAWYAEGEYEFAATPWKPIIGYRYGFWSGDDDAGTDSKRESFDSLFYYFGRGWGTWYQGEIAGEYLLFNTNQITHMAKVVVHPWETVALWALFFHHRLEEKNYFGIPVTDEHFMDEVNLILEWTPDKRWYLNGGVMYGFPGQAAKQIFGDDENYLIVQGNVVYTF